MTTATLPGIVRPALDAWLADHVEGAAGPLDYTLIAGGHSNLTFRIDAPGGRRFALRRPPLGNYPPSAHDVVREHRVMQALASTTVPVPRMVGLCTDTAVLGVPFFVMAWVDGPVVDEPAGVERWLPTPAARERSAFALVDVLAAIHGVDVDAVGLGDLGPRADYLSRQLERLRRVWDRTKTRELPLIEDLHRRLVAHRPRQRHTGLVHADYRLGNLILKPDDGLPAAVLDWELCALGDVLSDVGALLINWDLPDDPWPDVWMHPPPTRLGGFPSRDAIVERYAKRSGFALDAIDWYRAFAYWRIAVIAEGMKRRYEAGAMSSQSTDLEVLERRVRLRAELADDALRAFGG